MCFFLECVSFTFERQPCHSMTTEFWQQHFHNLLRARQMYLQGIKWHHSTTEKIYDHGQCILCNNENDKKNLVLAQCEIIYLRGNWRSIFCTTAVATTAHSLGIFHTSLEVHILIREFAATSAYKLSPEWSVEEGKNAIYYDM